MTTLYTSYFRLPSLSPIPPSAPEKSFRAFNLLQSFQSSASLKRLQEVAISPQCPSSLIPHPTRRHNDSFRPLHRTVEHYDLFTVIICQILQYFPTSFLFCLNMCLLLLSRSRNIFALSQRNYDVPSRCLLRDILFWIVQFFQHPNSRPNLVMAVGCRPTFKNTC